MDQPAPRREAPEIPDDMPPLRFPLADPPGPGEVVEVTDGVLWAVLPLPFHLDHVNLYFLRDGDGWAVIDTGIKTPEAIAAFESLLSGPLGGAPITRVIVTHFHPDHIGLAGWLCDRFDAPLLTSLSSYLTSRMISLAPDENELRRRYDFYVRHGMSAEEAGVVAIQGGTYLRLVAELPKAFHRLVLGDQLDIGGRALRVLSGDGHAPEQIMLWCEAEGLLFAADQVLERISPNISVFANEPTGDPLGHYLRSLRLMRTRLPAETLVLPGHRRPFVGLHRRAAELELHHEERCDLILSACADEWLPAARFIPVLFKRELDPHQMGFAFSETLAHVNRLIRRGELETGERDGVMLNRAV